MKELDRQVDVVRSNTILEKTREVYEYGIVRLLCWLYDNKPEALETTLLQVLHIGSESGEQPASDVCKFVNDFPLIPPVIFEAIDPRDFERFILAATKSNGEKPGKSTYGSLRSSLFHLYRTHEVPIPVSFTAEMKLFFKGLERLVAETSQREEGKITEGKEPLEFALYRALCKEMMKMQKKESIFSQTFLALSWSLMCRAGNTVAIRSNHMSWREDALTIRFGHMKNDEEGGRQKDASHIYANSIMPEACPILSLEIYFPVLGFSRESVLFPGAKQYDRYYKVLKRAMSLPSISDCLTRAGLNSNGFGSHSVRKRAATFVSSCSGGGPSSAFICLRAGWCLPVVQDSYVRYEAAGDQVVSRYVSGLPFEISSLAILPPLFREVDETIRAAVQVCFPGASSIMNKVCEFLLASHVYHATCLKTTLSLSHFLFENVLFHDVELLSKLQEKAICRHSSPIDHIIATGIPPHIGMLVVIQAQSEKIEALVDTIAGIASRIVDSVSVGLEKHSIHANSISKADISTAVEVAP